MLLWLQVNKVVDIDNMCYCFYVIIKKFWSHVIFYLKHKY